MKLQDLFEKAKHSDEDKVGKEYRSQSTAGIDKEDDAKHIAKKTGMSKRRVKKAMDKMTEGCSMENEESTELKGEAKRAYDDGFKDGKAGKDRKNASDVWGPHNGKYGSGYLAGQKAAKK